MIVELVFLLVVAFLIGSGVFYHRTTEDLQIDQLAVLNRIRANIPDLTEAVDAQFYCPDCEPEMLEYVHFILTEARCISSEILGQIANHYIRGHPLPMDQPDVYLWLAFVIEHNNGPTAEQMAQQKFERMEERICANKLQFKRILTKRIVDLEHCITRRSS
jgi:hypothetical protein